MQFYKHFNFYIWKSLLFLELLIRNNINYVSEKLALSLIKYNSVTVLILINLELFYIKSWNGKSKY